MLIFDEAFTPRSVCNCRDVRAVDAALAKPFNVLLRQKGLLKPDCKFYIPLAHDETDTSQAFAAIRWAAERLNAGA